MSRGRAAAAGLVNSQHHCKHDSCLRTTGDHNEQGTHVLDCMPLHTTTVGCKDLHTVWLALPRSKPLTLQVLPYRDSIASSWLIRANNAPTHRCVLPKELESLIEANVTDGVPLRADVGVLATSGVGRA